jgi:hypothetical protein
MDATVEDEHQFPHKLRELFFRKSPGLFKPQHNSRRSAIKKYFFDSVLA